jgi:hypothetical protein
MCCSRDAQDGGNTEFTVNATAEKRDCEEEPTKKLQREGSGKENCEETHGL